MFTGIVHSEGVVEAIEPRGGDVRLRIRCPELSPASGALGDSIAVNGVCLTAVALDDDGFAADVSRETLNTTALGGLRDGDRVNLERALTLSTPLGGHLVTGHVDGVGEVIESREEARSVRFRIRAPAPLARYIARKGSICIDGISLTVNEVEGAVFGVNIVPHTLEVTNVSRWTPGLQVNLEVDIVARYLERLLGGGSSPGLSLETLRENGFARSH
ncbi:MAG: riboflavin synthase [Gammaproteobacteria bacterium]|jgi:riboflavin synthase